MTIDTTTNATWAASWIGKLKYILADYPVITEAQLIYHCAVNLPADARRRADVVKRIKARPMESYDDWNFLKSRLALAVPEFDIKGELG